MPIRVVKVGGSLFSMPRLAATVTAWLNTQPPKATLLVAGGGRLADELRQLDRRFKLDEQIVHWLAIRTMGIHGELLASQMQLETPISNMNDVTSWAAAEELCLTRVIDPEPILRHQETPAAKKTLPCGWHGTSDSIAAHLAHVIAADELVLLKSSNPFEDAATRVQAANDGFVDEYFPVAANGIRLVRAVNLREPSFREITLDHT